MKKLVVLTGAGMSADSGLKTFRDNDGLWENHSIYDVATPEAWKRDQALVLEFYNQRRAQLEEVKPNKGHFILGELEGFFDVHIITQNVDNLHERAGSSNIMHLHGELTKARCSVTHKEVQDIGYRPITLGEKSTMGHQMRPHIVWFGEDVPLISAASRIVAEADVLIIIGTSMQVYPANGLVNFAKEGCPIYFINPDIDMDLPYGTIPVDMTAPMGLEHIRKELIDLA